MGSKELKSMQVHRKNKVFFSLISAGRETNVHTIKVRFSGVC